MIGTALLRLEVELLDGDNSHGHSSVNERWYGEFTSQYIEEITHKAGNFKKCPVFVKMLSAAFTEVMLSDDEIDLYESTTPPLCYTLAYL